MVFLEVFLKKTKKKEYGCKQGKSRTLTDNDTNVAAEQIMFYQTGCKSQYLQVQV